MPAGESSFWQHAAGATALRVLLAAAGLDLYLESRIEVCDDWLQSWLAALSCVQCQGIISSVCCRLTCGRLTLLSGTAACPNTAEGLGPIFPQVGTPVTAAIRYREGVQLARLNLSPYAGAAFHGPPLPLMSLATVDSLLFALLPGFTGVLASPWRTLAAAAMDVAAAAALGRLAKATAPHDGSEAAGGELWSHESPRLPSFSLHVCECECESFRA